MHRSDPSPVPHPPPLLENRPIPGEARKLNLNQPPAFAASIHVVRAATVSDRSNTSLPARFPAAGLTPVPIPKVMIQTWHTAAGQNAG